MDTDQSPFRKRASGVWKNLCKAVCKLADPNQSIERKIKSKVKSGEDTLFWIDTWVGETPLKFCFPALYAIEKHKRCCVKDRMGGATGGIQFCADWFRPLNSAGEWGEWNNLIAMISGIQLVSGEDQWSWVHGGDRSFSVKSVKEMLLQPAVEDSQLKWLPLVPKNVNIFGWRMRKQRLATKLGLRLRNINVGSLFCPLCDEVEESEEHLFTSCLVSSAIWAMISDWCSIPPIFAFSISDLLQVHQTCGKSPKSQKLVQMVVLAACWCVWLARNNKVFNGNTTSKFTFGHGQKP
ncbi:hypothetical protein SSX86_002844 [Deinandra increscens subsp. villosa]|uniref:Reverse transcriptase zinc-binding domain-containing protein n=1 Tax=Deinandra increscens subsp. villosa TaxID=3103831 RepID=A0AAP0DPX6_9ASTR